MSAIPFENILLAGSFLGFLFGLMFYVCKVKPNSAIQTNESILPLVSVDVGTDTNKDKAEPKDDAESVADSDSTAVQVDNLKKVEGIGPKIEGLLHAGGITTLRLLADTDAADVKKILEEAGPSYRMHEPTTWAAQATLIADERWDELKEYQDFLKGGKAP